MIKSFRSNHYNFNFNTENGYFERWGKTQSDDPDYCTFGPEIADIEITTICRGPGGKLCPFCYKANTPNGTYMTIDTFKEIFSKFNKEVLTQIAFGVDAQCESNPDTFKIMEYCRENGVIPNVTVADINDSVADKLANLCGAVAVSYYGNDDICFNSIKKLTDRGMTQINIHSMISNETFSRNAYLLQVVKSDHRLRELNAIVFLSLKKKGRGVGYNKMTEAQFKYLIATVFKNKIPFGFDSCTAPKFLDAIKDFPNYKQLEMISEPCESSLFSAYIDVHGNYYPCSFCENVIEPISMLQCDNFLNDIWYAKSIVEFRNKLLNNKNKNGIRMCPVYDI